MRLRDLDASLIPRTDSESLVGAQGIMFQCPKCGQGLERGEEDGRRFIVGAHYILVFFANPIGANPAPANASLRKNGKPNPRWTITSGTTLDDLTLSPSINCDIPDEETGEPSTCKFHGFVTNGDVA
jgi:hypothetical protein